MLYRYLLFLGLILGKDGQFSPELLSVQASRVLAWEVIVVAMEMLGLYVTNIQSSLRTLDLTAYSGYKYFGCVFNLTSIICSTNKNIVLKNIVLYYRIISCIPIGLLLGETAFYIAILYISVAFVYFLVNFNILYKTKLDF